MHICLKESIADGGVEGKGLGILISKSRNQKKEGFIITGQQLPGF